MQSPAHRRLLRIVGATVSVAAAALLSVTASAAASAAPGPSDADLMAYVQANDHPMGASIAAHDGSTPAATAGIHPDLGIQDSVEGIDVSGWQGNVDWPAYWAQGKRFAYVKATEGTGYQSPYFSQQYTGSYDVGMIRGAYHYARPDLSGATAQADYFVAHGGGWSADGKTLPGMLDIEWGPNNSCYGLSTTSMVNWILEFSDHYHALTSRWPVIYTATSWWTECTGNQGDFSSTNPLAVARYASSVGTLPYAWTFYTFWQYSSTPIDQDVFSGGLDRLTVLATG